MTLARAELVAALEAALPDDVKVEGYSRLNLSSLKVPHVLVKLEEVVPEPSAPQAYRRYSLELILVVQLTETPAADDLLDGLLEDVLYGLEQLETTGFESARRSVFEGTQTPAYAVRCYMICPKPNHS